MTKARTKFEKWHAYYKKMKNQFQDVVERFEKTGKKKLALAARKLLTTATKLDIEIQTDLDANLDDHKLRNKIKVYKECLKELREMTKSSLRQWGEAIAFALIAVFIIRSVLFGLYQVPTGSAEPTMLVGDRVWGNKLAYRLGGTPAQGDYIIVDNPEFKFVTSNSIKYLWQKYVGLPIPFLGLPAGPDVWTKRVIATPGDIIEGKIEDGKPVVYVNNEKLDEPYLNPYPLIGLRKLIGFVDQPGLGNSILTSWLVKKEKPVFYTYDPSRPFDDQPFYTMSKNKVLTNPMERGKSDPWLKWPQDPTPSRFGGSVDTFGPMAVPKGKYWVMGDSRRNSRDSRSWGFLDENLIQGRASFIIWSLDSEEPLWIFELLKHPIEFWTKKVRWDRFFTPIR